MCVRAAVDRVQHIIDNVVSWLGANATHKFQWEETVFFSMWWANRNASMHDAINRFVANGQLEFIGAPWPAAGPLCVHFAIRRPLYPCVRVCSAGGGWVMHDEADTQLFAVLNQMTGLPPAMPPRRACWPMLSACFLRVHPCMQSVARGWRRM